MSTPIRGLDCAQPLTATVAQRAARAGFRFACRYYGSGGKLLALAEARTICNAGLRIVSVFERTAGRALAGEAAGNADGGIAVVQAAGIGQPRDTVIFFAVDFDMAPGQIPAVIAYFRGVKAALAGRYRVGVYGNGAVCKAVRDAGLAERSWVWAGSKTHGTAAYTASGDWDARQYPTVTGGALEISYDPDDVRDLDAIAWRLAAAVEPRPDVGTPDIAEVQRRLNGAGLIPALAVDGRLGPDTKDALRVFQGSVSLPATGDPDPVTLAALAKATT